MGKKKKTRVDVRKFSSLSRLVKIIAWAWRAAKKWLEMTRQTRKQAKWEAMSLKNKPKEAKLMLSKCEDVLKDLFLAAQEGIIYPDITLSRLVVYRNMNSGLLLCGGRFEMFKEEKTTVPVLPYEAWVSHCWHKKPTK